MSIWAESVAILPSSARSTRAAFPLSALAYMCVLLVEFMAPLAMRLLGVLRREANTTKHVLAAGHRLHVVGVHAMPHSTKMVDNQSPDRADETDIRYAVDKPCFARGSRTRVRKVPVTFWQQATGPQPAVPRGIDILPEVIPSIRFHSIVQQQLHDQRVAQT